MNEPTWSSHLGNFVVFRLAQILLVCQRPESVVLPRNQVLKAGCGMPTRNGWTFFGHWRVQRGGGASTYLNILLQGCNLRLLFLENRSKIHFCRPIPASFGRVSRFSGLALACSPVPVSNGTGTSKTRSGLENEPLTPVDDYYV